MTTTGHATNDNKASGDLSHAEGLGSSSLGNYSHAEGVSCRGLGAASHAEGSGSSAVGITSHSEGNSAVAYGENSHAESNCIASGYGAHAEGNNATTGNPVQAFTIAPGGITVTIVGDVTAFFTNGDNVTILPQAPVVTRSYGLLVATVPAFGGVNTTFNLSGAIDGTTTDGTISNDSASSAAHAEGTDTIATGSSSHAEGTLSHATGASSHAEGSVTVSSGASAHAEGTETLASGASAHAEGNNCHATGDNSHAEGQLTVASGTGAHAEGLSCTASQYCHAQGLNAVATLEGESAEASGTEGGDGDFQYRRYVVRGTTPGVGAGEATLLRGGNGGTTALAVTSSKSYFVQARVIGTVMGLGAAARQSGCFNTEALVTVKSDGTVTVTSQTDVVALKTLGAGFVAATLVLASSGANVLTLTLTLAGGVTAQTQICGLVEFVEVLGS